MPLEQLGWDGSSKTRSDPHAYAAPDGADWNSMTDWAVSVQVAQQGGAQLNLIAGQNLLAGQPYYMADDAIWPAQASDATLAEVCGFTAEDGTPNFAVGCLTRGQITRADWTPITGTPELEPGKDYYLSPDLAGTMTPEAPTLMGHYVVSLGKAVTLNTFDVSIGKPIGL